MIYKDSLIYSWKIRRNRIAALVRFKQVDCLPNSFKQLAFNILQAYIPYQDTQLSCRPIHLSGHKIYGMTKNHSAMAKVGQINFW